MMFYDVLCLLSERTSGVSPVIFCERERSVWSGGHSYTLGPPYPPSLLSVNDPRITADLLTTLPTRFTLLPRTLMKYRPNNIKAVVNLAEAAQGIMLSQL